MLGVSTIIRDLPAALSGTATHQLTAAKGFNSRVTSAAVDLADAWAFSGASRMERSLVVDARGAVSDAREALHGAAPAFSRTRIALADAQLRSLDDHLLAYRETTSHVPFAGAIEDGDQLARRSTIEDQRSIMKSNGQLGAARDAIDSVVSLDTSVLEARVTHDAQVLRGAKLLAAGGTAAVALTGFGAGVATGRLT